MILPLFFKSGWSSGASVHNASSSQACLTNANLLASVRRCSVQVNDICILYIYIYM